MSVVHCMGCDATVDTDYNAEHFIEGTEECAEPTHIALDKK